MWARLPILAAAARVPESLSQAILSTRRSAQPTHLIVEHAAGVNGPVNQGAFRIGFRLPPRLAPNYVDQGSGRIAS